MTTKLTAKPDYPKVLIVHMDDGAPHEIHEVLLVHNMEEEQRAREAIKEWLRSYDEDDDESTTAEDSKWFRDRGFTAPNMDEIFL